MGTNLSLNYNSVGFGFCCSEKTTKETLQNTTSFVASDFDCRPISQYRKSFVQSKQNIDAIKTKSQILREHEEDNERERNIIIEDIKTKINVEKKISQEIYNQIKAGNKSLASGNYSNLMLKVENKSLFGI